MVPVIRPATTADLATVHRIESSSYPDPWPSSIFYLIRGRLSNLFLVAESEGSVVGYAIGEMERRKGVAVGHVMNVAVAEISRNKGLARMLMDELERRFREGEAEAAYLEVRAANIPAQNLYKKRGYVETGVLPGYYRNEDGIRMEKLLT